MSRGATWGERARYAAHDRGRAAAVGRGRRRGHRRPAVLAALHELVGRGPRPPAHAERDPLGAAAVLLRASSSCPVLLAALLGIGVAIWAAPRRALMPLVLLASGIGTFVLIGIAGLSVIERYLIVGALALLVFAAVARRRLHDAAARPPADRVDVRLRAAAARRARRSRPRASTPRKLTNELQFRGDAHTALMHVLHEPAVKRALRCGPLTAPNHKLVPDSRWILDLPAQPRARARRPGRPAPQARRGALRHEPLRDLPPRLHQPGRPDLGPGAARRLAADRDQRLRRRVCPLLSGAGAWPLAVAALVLAAFGLRLWGFRQGLPYVYNADENAHFVAGAIGMFGHTYNPNYFINPPAFTYLLHVAFALGFGGRDGRLELLRGGPDERVRARAGAVGRARRDRGRACWRGRARGCSTAASASSPPRCWRSPSCPCTTRTSRSTTCRRWRRCASRWSASAASSRAGGSVDYALAGVGPGAGLRDQVHRRDRAAAAAGRGAGRAGPGRRGGGSAGSRWPAGSRSRRSWSPTRSRCSTSTRSATGLSEQSAASSDGGGKLGLTASSGIVYYLGTTTWGLGWLPALAALGGAVVLAVRDWRRALVLVPALVVFVLFMGTQDRYFARWLLPVYPLAAPARRLRRRCAALAWLRRPALGGRRGRRPAVRAGARVRDPQRRRARPRRHAPARARLDGRARARRHAGW